MKNYINLTLLFSLLFVLSCSSKKEQAPEYTPLFNSTDLSGWETYIGVPRADVEVEGLAKDSTGAFTEPIGFNKDPLAIFTVVSEDGEPAVRASGQVNGSLATVGEFENYHYRMQVKWGTKKWLAGDRPRNSGLLYHGTGEYGLGLGVWKISHECQVMETMFGDSYRMGDTYCNITATKPEGGDRFVYDPNGPSLEVGGGKEAGKIVSKSVMAEKPYGEWNTVEIVCFEDKSYHIINGVVNMINTNSHLEVEGQVIPLTKGNIQLQSEGSEVFFRKMEIREITAVPEEYLK
ncbi:DUF1080 domain-containing protein [Bacteroidota bacterium]